MKKRAKKGTALLLLTSSLSAAPLYGCGSVKDWLTEFVAKHEDQIEFVEVQGQALFNAVVKSVIQSLQQLYIDNQQVFIEFINASLNNSIANLPASTVNVLKAFNLVQADGTISDTIKNIVSMSIEKLDDGSIEIWSMDDLISEGWITTLKAQA